MSGSTAGARGEGTAIAICGMAGRIPGASDLDRFWRNLCQGVESIRRFTDEELLAAGEKPEKLADPNYVKARPILDDVEGFDAAFFGFTPREAEIMDPQLRLFLECAWEALDAAGCDTARFPGAIGLFAGASFSNYLVHNVYKNRPVFDAFGHVQATILNVQDALVTMAGYKLNLRGPCCAVQTFCSTSLVGVHLACQSLLNYESDVALAGGVSVYVPQHSGYLYEEGGIVSPDGHCRAFDARAAGTVFGSGVGVVVLKRLGDALAEGDPVLAVIRGSAMNNDGALKVSYAAPSVVGQTEVIVEALGAAGVGADTIGYVETHGTGTLLGDPAEVSALTKAFRRGSDRKGFCAIGSVKANVGHLDAAAGVVGLMKAVLCLSHGRIPPSPNFETPNPQIDFANSPFYVNTELREWPPAAEPRRAAVSAFGVGGTNAHVILEEAPAASPSGAGRAPQLLLLSARTETALTQAARNLAAHLRAHPEADLADVAWTLQVGRRGFSQRWMAACSSRSEAIASLEACERGRAPRPAERRNPPVGFVLPGSPVPSPNVGRELYEREGAFRAAFDRCAAAARPWLGGDALAGLVYPEPSKSEQAALRLQEPRTGPAALFAVEYALAQLWAAWGVRPAAMAGFGVGELVAACLADALTLDEALRLAVERGAGEAGYEDACRSTPPRAPRIPFVSGLTGEWMDAGTLMGPDHWRARFGSAAHPEKALEALRARADDLLVDVGPDIAPRQVLETLGRLWLAGAEPDWAAVHAPARPRRVPLPPYPFERERHWVAPLEDADAPAPAEPPSADVTRWIYQPVWKTARLPAPAPTSTAPASPWLVFADRRGIAAALAEGFRAEGGEAILVWPGESFGGDPRAGYHLRPDRGADYDALVEDLRRRGSVPSRVAHLWSLDSGEAALPARERFAAAATAGFYSLLHLAPALLRPPAVGSLELVSSPADCTTWWDASG